MVYFILLDDDDFEPEAVAPPPAPVAVSLDAPTVSIFEFSLIQL